MSGLAPNLAVAPFEKSKRFCKFSKKSYITRDICLSSDPNLAVTTFGKKFLASQLTPSLKIQEYTKEPIDYN